MRYGLAPDPDAEGSTAARSELTVVVNPAETGRAVSFWSSRFHLHFTPTSSSWLNLVERWFRDFTDKALRREVFHSVPDLIVAIENYMAANNHDSKSSIWAASAEAILEQVRRGGVALARLQKVAA